MASVLTRPRVVQPKPKGRVRPKTRPESRSLSGLRHVDYEWLGTRNRWLLKRSA